MGIIRRFVKCLLPCITRRSRSPSPETSRNSKENKTFENCNETTNRRTGTQYEAPIKAERQLEIIDIQRMIRQEEKSRNNPQFLRICLEGSKQGHRREERGLCLEDFKIIKKLGEGSFGQVLLAKNKSTCELCCSEDMFAIKSVLNEHVSEVEKEVFLRAVGHPFLLQLFSYFQDKESFCYVMGYYEGGTLYSKMSRLQRFDVELARFYATEIILAVKFLHKCGIIHRDIKPHNILLERDGHCRLADFGLSAIGIFKEMRTRGRCGTPRYMAPEVLSGRSYGPEVDWWSVGCVMLDMMAGNCPDEWLLHPEEPPLCMTKDAVVVINNFLEQDPTGRLGAKDKPIMTHPFFKSVNWEAVLHKRVKPPVTSEFVIVDVEAPRDTKESQTDLSFKTANEGPMPEGPSDKLHTAKSETVDRRAGGKLKKLATAVTVVVVSFVLIGNILYK
jgi:serine/threonine protein kinase